MFTLHRYNTAEVRVKRNKMMGEFPVSVKEVFIFSRGHATLHLAVSVGRSVGPSVRPSVHPSVRLISELWAVYALLLLPTVRDCPAVYPALFNSVSCMITTQSVQKTFPKVDVEQL